MKQILLCLALFLPLPAAAEVALSLAAAAREQVGVTLHYDPAYTALTFPNGDVDASRGVCTDVVIRALRQAWGIDLQRAVNRDMKASFAAYPQNWGLKTTDRNIDHRRVPNLQTLLRRNGAEMAITDTADSYQSGDIVSWMLPGNLPHIGIVSDKRSADGLRPLVLHNIGAGTQEEDRLFDFPITGHFRIGPEVQQRLKRLNR